MKAILLTCTLLFTALLQLAAADNNTALWNKANNWYHQKQYDSAAAAFEQIAALKPNNAELFYNLGNTYYRLNKIGPAVLNYERALHINPAYKEARENLLLTQSRMTNHIHQANEVFFINWWDDYTMGTKATRWAILALITFICVIGLSATIYFRLTSFKIPVQIPGVLGFVWICFMILAYFSALNNRSNKAVVMQNDAPLLNLERKGSKPLSLLPEGTTLKLLGVKGDYAEVILPDGRKGWIQLSWINKI